jgi:hypothetical protein
MYIGTVVWISNHCVICFLIVYFVELLRVLLFVLMSNRVSRLSVFRNCCVKH